MARIDRRPENMELKQIRHFIVVADELNFSRAADRLNLSQPALSRQIHDLELSIRARLFERTSRKVILTEAGKLFYQHARNITDQVARAAEECHRLSTGQRGTLNIGIFGSSTLDLVPEMMRRLSVALPGVKVSLHTMDKDTQVQALREHRLTGAFNRLVPEETDIQQEVIRRENLLVAVPEQHRLAALEAVTLGDIAGEPLILYPRGIRDGLIVKVMKLFEAAKLIPNLAQEVGDAPTAIALVGSGMGISIAPQAVTNLGVAGVVYRPLSGDPPPSVELVCLYRRGDRSPILASFLKAVRDARDALTSRQTT